jgi:excisionase family DNA binding protein
VPLDEVRDAARPCDPPSLRRSAPDLSGLAALLQLPAEMQALRADVGQLRAVVDQLRRALPPALLGVADAARALGVSTVTVRRMIRSGKLAHVRVGRCVKVDLTRTPIESVNIEDGLRAVAMLSRR